MHRSNAQAQLLPVLSLLLTASLWGLVWYPLRLLESQGLEGLWLSLASYGAALLTGLYWLWRDRAYWVERFWLMSMMMLAVGWCNVAFVLAILDGTVVRVLLLFYLSPLWALVLGWLFLGERPGQGSLLVFGLAMGGAGIMLWNPAMGFPWPNDAADWLAVSSGFMFSVANVMVRKAHGVSMQAKSVASWLGVVLVAGVWIILVSEPFPQLQPSVWLSAALLGWLGFVVMTVTVIYGVTHMPVHRSATILLFELVIGAVSSQMLTDEQVLLQEWVGGALILVAAYLAARTHVKDAIAG